MTVIKTSPHHHCTCLWHGIPILKIGNRDSDISKLHSDTTTAAGRGYISLQNPPSRQPNHRTQPNPGSAQPDIVHNHKEYMQWLVNPVLYMDVSK